MKKDKKEDDYIVAEITKRKVFTLTDCVNCSKEEKAEIKNKSKVKVKRIKKTVKRVRGDYYENYDN